MFECVAEVASQAIEYFWKHPKFCGQYIPFFEISKVDDNFYFKLIEPTLKRKIEEKLKDPHVPTVDGAIVPLSKAVKITEEIEDFIQKGFLKKDDLSIIFKEEGLNFIGKDVKTGSLNVKQITLEKLHNKELIEKKLKEGKGIDFIAELYREADKRNRSFYGWFIIDKEFKIQSKIILKGIERLSKLIGVDVNVYSFSLSFPETPLTLNWFQIRVEPDANSPSTRVYVNITKRTDRFTEGVNFLTIIPQVLTTLKELLEVLP